MADSGGSDVGSGKLDNETPVPKARGKRSDSRRSPTTGHRRKHKEGSRRSHSMDLRTASEKLTSSEEELIGKCREMIDEAKQVQQSKIVKRKVKQKESENKGADGNNKEEQSLTEPPRLPWWKRLLPKIDKSEEQVLPHKEKKKEKPAPVAKVPREPLNLRQLIRDFIIEYRRYMKQYANEVVRIKKLRNRCFNELLLIFILCGCGAFVFKTTEGTFEQFYKCGVKRVKRDFIEELWRGSHFLREDEWKSKARKKLMEFENQLQDAFEAGMTTYSGQKCWSFLNAVIYCLTVITTIGPLR